MASMEMLPTDNDPSLVSGEDFSDPELAKIWKTILRPGTGKDERFTGKYFDWRRPISVQGLLGQSRLWTSWGYKAAYPKLAEFLDKASLDRKFRIQVILEEFETCIDEYLFRKLRYNEAHAPLSDIFDALKTFPTQAVATERLSGRPNDARSMARLVRIIHMTDISPLVLNCVFGTSSSLIISHIAAFLEKYLSSANWGKVNLLQIHRMDWSTFTYEYHMSFFNVTHGYFDSDTIKPDIRGVRKSCPFGQAKNAKSRYIHQETVSFLLCGHFDEVVTCFQLADAYYKPRYMKSAGPLVFRSCDPKQSPGQVLLYWLAIALFHARSRWESAIDALDAEIKSPCDVVFMQDRDDLMADDPQFSLSKTYFWALQTYKLFERTLEQTILAWDVFKQHSLLKVRDGRISGEDWDTGVNSIEQGMEQLKLKLIRVRRGIQDVRDLREGLQSTAAVFDSRTAVRQGENIRLLTYITILFLPLSFGTSIFGMQIIQSTPQAIKAFEITLPSITVVTALLIINLESILAQFSRTTRKLTSALQVQMRSHHRTNWGAKAHALQQDHLATKPPARKVTKQSSHWVYILFVIETIVVLFPVSEVAAAVNCYNIFSSFEIKDEEGEQSDDEPDPISRKRKIIQQKVNKAVEAAKESENKRKLEERGPIYRSYYRLRTSSLTMIRTSASTVLTFLRIIFLPIWTMLLAIELMFVLLAISVFGRKTEVWNESQDPQLSNAPRTSRSSFDSAWKVLCLDTIKLPKGRRTQTSTKPQGEEQSKLEKGKFLGFFQGSKQVDTALVGGTSRGAPLEGVPSQITSLQGQFELDTWRVTHERTADKIRRAVHYAGHGGGYIPGDTLRVEMAGGQDPSADEPPLGSPSHGSTNSEISG